jgi:hypothetical protein
LCQDRACADCRHLIYLLLLLCALHLNALYRCAAAAVLHMNIVIVPLVDQWYVSSRQ